ncbi:MAG: hypothetical protein GXO00_00500 [Candidatus Diapherotrites archaeon]|nr:hypothetical protein [Candidatus Diapherotrites archaeon]
MYRIRRRWTIREVELHPDLLLSRRRLLRWFALSLGLLNERDQREGIIVLLDVLFEYWFLRGRNPSFDDIKHSVARRYLERGSSPPSDEALRKHLRKLVKMGLVEREKGVYRLSTHPLRPDDPLTAIDSVFDRILSTKELIKTGFSHLKKLYER